MKTVRILCATLLAIATGACTTAPTRAYRAPDTHQALPEKPAVETPPKPQPKPQLAELPASCPVRVPGTTVAMEQTPQGGALVFTTIGDADALRTQLYAMADTHNEMHAKMGPLPVEGGAAVAGADGAATNDTTATTDATASSDAAAATPSSPPTKSDGDLTGTATDQDKSYGGTSDDGNTIAAETKDAQKKQGADKAPAAGAASDDALPSPSDGVYASGVPTTTAAPADDESEDVLTHSRARVESIASGARLVFVAFPDDVQALRNELQRRADSLQRQCAWGDADRTD
jgi:hypothetical protein